jgi:hypothetical protein
MEHQRPKTLGAHVRGECNENTQEPEVRQRAVNYSRGLKNSNPNRRMSPATDCLRILAEIGGVSFGTTLEEEVGEGAGTVILTTWSGRRK